MMGRKLVLLLTTCFAFTCLSGSSGTARADQKYAGGQPKEDSGFMGELTEGARKAKKLYKHTADKIKNWSREKLNKYLERLATYRPVLKKGNVERDRTC